LPAQLERCIAELQAKWSKDPGSRPKPLKKDQDAKSQAWAICTASLKKAGKLSDTEYVMALTEAGDGDMSGRVALYKDLGYTQDEAARVALADRVAQRDKIDGLGPALKGIALTIIPFIKRQKKASVVERDGVKLLRIPIMRKGTWRHPLYGVLRFDDAFFSKMVHNFRSDTVGQDVPVKDGHKPAEQHALGWVKELAVEGEGLVAYAPPTDEQAVEIVEKSKAPYASAEFVFDYRDNELKPLSFDGLEETSDEDEGTYHFSREELEVVDCEGCLEERMPENDKTMQVNLADWQALQDRLRALEEVGGRVKTLETQLGERDERIVELELVNESAMVAHLVERSRAYRDSEHRAHSAIFLNAYEAALTMSEIRNGDEVAIVSLSDGFEITEPAAQMRDYFRGVLRYLAEHLPGTVPTENGVEPHEHRELEQETVDENLGADLWG